MLILVVVVIVVVVEKVPFISKILLGLHKLYYSDCSCASSSQKIEYSS